MDKTEALEILETETQWHREHLDPAIDNEDWKDGFIAGCEQCIHVIEMAE